MTLQGHPRSLILATIESAHFLLVPNSNFDLILPRFRESFCTPKATFPHPIRIRTKISGRSLSVVLSLHSADSEHRRLTN